MKMPTMFAVAGAAVVSLLVACSSSSSSSGGTGSVPSCQGAAGSTGPGSSACSSCLQSSCGSQLSSYLSSCSAYNGCYEACQCSDTNCIAGCLSKIDSTCQSPFGSFAMCLSQSCASQCMVTVPIEGGTD